MARNYTLYRTRRIWQEMALEHNDPHLGVALAVVLTAIDDAVSRPAQYPDTLRFFASPAWRFWADALELSPAMRARITWYAVTRGESGDNCEPVKPIS